MYSLTFVLNNVDTPLSNLRADITTSTGTVLASNVSSGFSALGGKSFHFVYSAFPDNSSGTVVFKDSSTGNVIIAGAFNPVTSVIPSEGAATEAVVVPPPGGPGTVAAYLYTRDANGAVVSGKTVYYRMVAPPVGSGGAWSDDPVSVVSDANGLVSLPLVVGARYDVWAKTAKRRSYLIASTPNPLALDNLTY